jgi:streptogramin lyase
VLVSAIIGPAKAQSGTYSDIAIYSPPTANSGPQEMTVGSDGALWFTESSSNKIGRFSTSGAITEYVIPTDGSDPTDITLGPDGALWFTEWFGNNIGLSLPPGSSLNSRSRLQIASQMALRRVQMVPYGLPNSRTA